MFKKRLNPDYVALSEADKKTLDYFTSAILGQENLVTHDLPLHLRLVNYSPSGKNVDALEETDFSIPTVYLPKMSRSSWETGLNPTRPTD